MDIHSDYVGSTSSAYENVSFGKAEDSGYHTSTPSSFECDELSNQYFNPSIIGNVTISSIGRRTQLEFNPVTPEQNFILYQPCNHSTAYMNLTDTPVIRRGVKRPYPSEELIETPTSFIAGKIRSLEVNENKENSKPTSPVSLIYFDAIDKRFLHHDEAQISSYPSTPVKRNCNKQSPCRKSGKKIHFITHSLSCETNGLQQSNKVRINSKAVRNILFAPERKLDIVSKLQEAQALPPIENIFKYLSNKDIHNFCLVNKTWNNTWKFVSHKNKRKQNYFESLKTAKQNLENREKGATPVKTNVKPKRHLKEIHNELNDIAEKVPNHSPPGTPTTNRFKTFTKSALLDARTQVPCVRCYGPAKVTQEASGELWAQCNSMRCSYQFCKDCSCDRHPSKCCSQYDLSCPSPSKRKKLDYSVGTKKSRKNLRRL